MSMFKKIILIVFLFSFLSVSFAGDKIKIGIDYNQNINEAIISSSDDFYVEYDDDYLFDLEEDLLKVYKSSGYYLKYDKNYDKVDKALSKAEDFDNAFLYYDGDWNIYIGSYRSKSDAKNHGDSDFDVVDLNSNSVILKDDSNDIIFAYDTKYELSFISDEVVNYNKIQYRGGFLFKRHTGSNLTIINKLPIKEYLYGVVPREMPKDWPIEALKAQAVSARNFAITNMGDYKGLGFDLTDDIYSQVYGGYSAEGKNSNRAVDETEDMVLKYNDKIITAYYHSNSGGQTESVKNVWQADIPYLRGVEDEFSENVHNSTWSKTYDVDEVSSILNNSGYNVGSIYDVEVLSRSANNRVMEIEFKGSRDNAILKKGKTREVFGYYDIRSMWFDINSDSNKSIKYISDSEYSEESLNNMTFITANGIKKADDFDELYIYDGETKKKIKTSTSIDDKIKFNGRGFGHGIGMSQWGAKVMADEGYDFDEILAHYYKGTYLEEY